MRAEAHIYGIMAHLSVNKDAPSPRTVHSVSRILPTPEIFEPLADKFEAEIGKTRSIAAGTADALDELGPDRIGDIHEHHRDGRGGFLDIGRRTADAHQHIGCERHKLGRHPLKLLRLFVAEPVNELDFPLLIPNLSDPPQQPT